MANVLTKGSVLSDSLIMQRIWAWTQCIAIDASVAGTIIRTFRYFQEKERIKFFLYALLSTLLLFTAAIVSNIESEQQTLNLTLESAYLQRKRRYGSAVNLVTTILNYFNGIVSLREVFAVGEQLQQ